MKHFPFFDIQNNFYPTFGSLIKDRAFQDFKNFRYKFNGKESDGEINGEGNNYDFGARIYDNRLGRFLSIDRLGKNFSFKTPYDYAENDVIRSIDLEGAEKFEKTGDNKMLVTIVYGVVTDPNSAILGNKFKPAPKIFTSKDVEDEVKAVYINEEAEIPAQQAALLGFKVPEGTDMKKGTVKVQVEFNVSVVDVKTGEGFVNKDKPENFSLVVTGALKDKPAQQKNGPAGDMKYTVLNKDVIKEGMSGEALAKEITAYYNNIPNVIKSDTPISSGALVGHEGAHPLFGEGDAGHKQLGALDTEGAKIKVNKINLKNLFIKQGGNIKDQLVPKKK